MTGTSLTPWREPLANWPDEWRERWGIRANQLEESGLGWVEAERQAWNETLELRKSAAVLKVEPRQQKTARTLFKESA